jgi:hypothetical protein
MWGKGAKVVTKSGVVRGFLVPKSPFVAEHEARIAVVHATIPP